MTIFACWFVAGQAWPALGDGSQVRDFTYVGDVVAINDAVLAQDISGHEVYNVATGVGTTVAESNT